MQSPGQDGPVLPVIVRDAQGTALWYAITNTKGRLKSLEQGEPWLLDGESGRLLPLSQIVPPLASRGKYLDRIEEIPGGLAFTLKAGVSFAFSDIRRPELQKIEPTTPEANQDTNSVPDANALYTLEALIRERKLLMPEGSYTTHLFSKGLSKIRKKTGEEAIELLLAEKPEEVAGEAADLLYHMLVLLVALELPLERVFEELKKR